MTGNKTKWMRRKKLLLYLDAALEAVELWGKGHAPHKQSSSHVGKSYHQLLGLFLNLNGQLSGGGQDQSHRAVHTNSLFLKIGVTIQIKLKNIFYKKCFF